MKALPLFVLSTLLCASFKIYAQDCHSSIRIKLININGGVYADKQVQLFSKLYGNNWKQTSNASGEVEFEVPCNSEFELSVSNYSGKKIIESGRNESVAKYSIKYEPDMILKEKKMTMNAIEINQVNNIAKALPDSCFIGNEKMKYPKNPDCFVQLTLTLKDYDREPLVNEHVKFKSIKRKKIITGYTDSRGTIQVYLPKGDSYSLNFIHHPNFEIQEYNYSKGTSEVSWNITYIGTKKYETIKKEEAERLVDAEIRIKKERADFEKECKKLGITVEEGFKKRFLIEASNMSDTTIVAALNRNKWENKLIVCDLTGSMQPYASQLALWYQLRIKTEKNLQFVFFNDGDNMPDSKKVIGNTGGIYYSKSKGLDSLGNTIAYVSSKGSGGDGPENNMEALIKGCKLASNYDEIIAIVDNYAPIKDIELLKDFNQPVHVVLCGATSGYILNDYLMLAWKTGGTIHTIEQDITSIAKMHDGEDIKINGINYKLAHGEFIRTSKM